MERLRYFVLLWLLICFVSIANTQEKEGKIFGSFDEYNSYVFGNSDLRTLTNGYFLNYAPEMTPDEAQKLFSLYDKRLIQLKNKSRHEQGNYKIEFNGINLLAGTYLVKIATDNKSVTQKIIKIQ